MGLVGLLNMKKIYLSIYIYMFFCMSLYIVIYNYLRFNNTHSLTQNFPGCRPHSLPTLSYSFDLPEDRSLA